MRPTLSIIAAAAVCVLLSACSGSHPSDVGGGTSGGSTTGGTTGGGSTTGGTTGGSTSGGTTGGTTGGSTTGGAGPGIIDPTTGFLSNAASITHSTINDGNSNIRVTPGTTAYSANIVSNGVTRRYVVLRPDPATSGAPVLLLLHPSLTSPETMANLTQVADYVLTQGFWAVLPEGTGGLWNEDPAVSNSDDVQFISTLIDSLVTNDGVDGNRIYAGGFSNGGFMSERLACELSDKIAAFVLDAATLRGSEASVCGSPARLRSKIYFLGTADLIVAYNGVLSGSGNGLKSAADTMAFWQAQQQCGGLVSSAPINNVNDSTSVQLDNYTGCAAGTGLQLYTITNGGHAWPGGDPSFTGLTTQEIQATGLGWLFVKNARK